jgi:predicted nucleic acid-binding protein
VKYVDASAILRILFAEPGPTVPLGDGDRIVSSQLVEVEVARAVDRERLAGHISDTETATKRQELAVLVAMLDLLAVDASVIARAKGPFAVSVRAMDALHIATAEVLAAEADTEPLEFWTHDQRQADAAVSRGLVVVGTARTA